MNEVDLRASVVCQLIDKYVAEDAIAQAKKIVDYILKGE